MFRYHEIPALTEEELRIWREKKNQVDELNKRAYGKKSTFEPVYMNRRDVNNELYDIFSGNDFKKILEGYKKLRSILDYESNKLVVEKILGFYLSPRTPVSLYLQVTARDMGKIDSTKDPNRGLCDRHTLIKTLTVEEWQTHWEEFVFLDTKADSEEIEKHTPKPKNAVGRICQVSTVTKFIEAEKTTKKNGKNNNGLDYYDIIDPKFETDARTKSGSHFAYKLDEYLIGTRSDINDFIGWRQKHKENYEDRSVDLISHLFGKEIGNCEGLLKLQSLDSNIEAQRKDFLKNLSRCRNFCEKYMTTEDKSHIFKHNPEELKKLKKKHYLESLFTFSTLGNYDSSIGRNIISNLSYTVYTSKKIDQNSDHFAYEGRKEDERDKETWRYIHWALLDILKEFLTGFSRYYIEQISVSRLVSKNKTFVPL